MSTGVSYYYATHDHSDYLHDWYFNQRNYAWLKADKTEVSIYNTYYYNGDADSPDVQFAILWIWDEQGYSSQSYWGFCFEEVDGIDQLETTSWNCDQMSEDYNEWIAVQQYVIDEYNGFWMVQDGMLLAIQY
jgi:hypothetical protein